MPATRGSGYYRRRYVRRKAEGLCVICGKNSQPPGSLACAACQARRKAKLRENYLHDYKSGTCPRCRRAKAAVGHCYCRACAAKDLARKNLATADRTIERESPLYEAGLVPTAEALEYLGLTAKAFYYRASRGLITPKRRFNRKNWYLMQDLKKLKE